VKGRVVWVVDSDTIHVQLGRGLEKVRYIGVNAPEIPHPQARGWLEGGAQALEVNRQLVAGQGARLVLDVRHRDNYGLIECTKGCRIFPDRVVQSS
jgi:endonuclease YncB( thermonuclease family)